LNVFQVTSILSMKTIIKKDKNEQKGRRKTKKRKRIIFIFNYLGPFSLNRIVVMYYN
jgi:hypothetical protein